jgi:hypothetical protein
VLLEGLGDLLVEGLQTFVHGKDASGELGDDGRGEILAGQQGRLPLGRRHRPGGHLVIVPHLPVPQPARQSRLAEPANPIRAGIAGEQHQRTLVGGVVEFSFQAGEHAGHQVP